ncbi:hypothetical protein KCTC52924_00689 [Arenibacter antarcticus]|uniref:Uncharacterized protein n=1 Tax=Arenibacter antarcticus TaxID=2040469 RepID=A0ABW5VBY3_9FLAO|nr:hypothetical protein [Arenibacter sp. H213]MCM4169248.1 hypothetical protein [Arenibacter sp. H213]
MVQQFPNSTALLIYAQENKLYQDLVLQLRKDFVLANVGLDFPDTISPMDLKTVVHEKVYYLIMEKFAEYLNVLYIIDVPEKAIKAIKTNDVVEISREVSFEILKREWQKVWFRNKYRS